MTITMLCRYSRKEAQIAKRKAKGKKNVQVWGRGASGLGGPRHQPTKNHKPTELSTPPKMRNEYNRKTLDPLLAQLGKKDRREQKDIKEVLLPGYRIINRITIFFRIWFVSQDFTVTVVSFGNSCGRSWRREVSSAIRIM
ncbi:hypothetical protein TWF225_002133 [Orbilia oligospora]|uniref:Uncharacterized protein n=1 Tax=Orbilia oligospora TaxID=2813651 RepID=A0A8H2HLC6_ORBOL|nr:hypothetical protein TWF225_002133 [Orbilia oligospora]KAF3242756.1 hypothetical protein TWF217_011463 [Orbilia oligospora]KAF3258019.1 hypothetical protein TWF128_004914 [Orbilia oligospora]KAF3280043.1 hypothetical protein TWF132_011895 [Orbilia oligospora]TGJ65775.1 hypothetical protein EYR41_009721 [Orbilia oligospora]